MVSTDTFQQEGFGFSLSLGPFWVEVACFPCGCVGCVQVLSPKNPHRLFGNSKLLIGVSVSMRGRLCLYIGPDSMATSP